MEQNTRDWEHWRGQGLGASDAPVVMGVSKFKTPLQLWDEKRAWYTGNPPEASKPNFIQALGHEIEPIMKQKFYAVYDIQVEPRLFETRYLRASMDGANLDESVGIEIKLLGREDFDKLKKGIVPPQYKYQICHQYMVTGLQTIYLAGYLYKKGDRVNMRNWPSFFLPVARDEKMEAEYSEVAENFWNSVQSGKRPEPGAKDFKSIRSVKAKTAARAYMAAQAIHEDASLKLKEAREKLLEFAPDETGVKIGDLLTIRTIERAGSVDYKKIPAIQSIDLEKFRKPSTKSKRIDIIKD